MKTEKTKKLNLDRFMRLAYQLKQKREVDAATTPNMKCETCQSEATVHIEPIGCHFCAACLKKVDARIARMNAKQPEFSPLTVHIVGNYYAPHRLWAPYLMSWWTVFRRGNTTIGYIHMDGLAECPKVEEFVIFPRYRGRGYARQMAEYLPARCWLVPSPLPQYGKGLSSKALVKFYQSLGFRWRRGKKVMER